MKGFSDDLEGGRRQRHELALLPESGQARHPVLPGGIRRRARFAFMKGLRRAHTVIALITNVQTFASSSPLSTICNRKGIVALGGQS